MRIKNIIILIFTLSITADLCGQDANKLYQYEWHENRKSDFNYCDRLGTVSYPAGGIKNSIVITPNSPLKFRDEGKYYIKNIYGDTLFHKAFKNVLFPEVSGSEKYIGSEFAEYFLGSSDKYSYSNEVYYLYSLKLKKPIFNHPFTFVHVNNKTLSLGDSTKNTNYHIIPKDDKTVFKIDSINRNTWINDPADFGIIKDLGSKILYGYLNGENENQTINFTNSMLLEMFIQLEPKVTQLLNITSDSLLIADSLYLNKKVNAVKNYVFRKALEDQLENIAQSQFSQKEKNQNEFNTLNLVETYSVQNKHIDKDSSAIYVVSNERGEIGLINSEKEMILPFKKRNILIKKFHNVLDYVILEEVDKRNYNIFNGNGLKAKIKPIKYISSYTMNNEIYYVVKDDQNNRGLINSNFDVIKDVKYSDIRILHNKFLVIKNKAKNVGYIELDGKEIFRINSNYIGIRESTQLPFIIVDSKFENISFRFLIDIEGECILPSGKKEFLIENDIIFKRVD